MSLGINILEEGNDRSPYQSEVKHIADFIPRNSDDDLVYALAGQKNAVIVTYDRDFKEISQKANLYKQNKVGVVYFRSYKKVLRYWDIVLSFINHWEDLKRMIAETEKPFIIEVTLQGLSSKTL